MQLDPCTPAACGAGQTRDRASGPRGQPGHVVLSRCLPAHAACAARRSSHSPPLRHKCGRRRCSRPAAEGCAAAAPPPGITATTSRCWPASKAGQTPEPDTRPATCLASRLGQQVPHPANVGDRLIGVPTRLLTSCVTGAGGPHALDRTARSQLRGLQPACQDPRGLDPRLGAGLRPASRQGP